MAYEFTKLSEVEALSEVPENATVLAEVDGSIKRVPGSGLGGGSSLVITGSDFANAVSGVSTLTAAAQEIIYTANMTLTEALTTLRECKLSGGFVYTTANEMPIGMLIFFLADATFTYNTECLCIVASDPGASIMFYWTADGISTTEPSSGK